jgi:DNA-directed RNA polymerase specialized sigma24 family protein
MTSAAILRDCETEWESAQAIIHSMIRKMINKYGGDYEEFESEARMAFMQAWSGFNCQQDTKFATWLYHKLRGRFLEYVRCRARRWSRAGDHLSYGPEEGQVEVALEFVPLADVFDELSDDGRFLAELILQTPIALQIETSPRRLLKSLASFMSENYGWTSFRSAITFSEISDALH